MKSLLQKDKRRRFRFSKLELRWFLYRALLKNQFIGLKFRSMLYSSFKLPINSSLIRIKNRCRLTGRAGSVYRRFRLSRLSFRELANSGQLPGIVRSSW